jgi:hypothetical protein
MFAYRRKRSLGCEQLEGRFAPSSVLVGTGGRSTFKDAQALETAQAEQAAFYLAASAVVSQSSSVANVAPITFDQPATGNADGAVVSEGVLGVCRVLCPETRFLVASGDWNVAGDTVTYETWQCTLGAPAPGTNSDVPFFELISPETPSEQGNDVDAVGAVPFEEQRAGGDDLAAEDFLPVVDDTLVAGDEVAEPVVEDTGVPDASDTEELPWCGNDFEDLGPIYPVGTDTEYTDAEITDAYGSDELAVDEVPVEYQSDDAADEVAPVDA